MMEFITHGQLLYFLPFLELFPKYICPESNPDCGPADACSNPAEYPIDWSDPRSIYNWVDVFNLQCAEPY